jgi:hypothetical protein
MAAGIAAQDQQLLPNESAGESPLWYRQDSRKASHGDEHAALITESTLQHGHAVNLHAMPCGCNNEPSGGHWRG